MEENSRLVLHRYEHPQTLRVTSISRKQVSISYGQQEFRRVQNAILSFIQ